MARDAIFKENGVTGAAWLILGTFGGSGRSSVKPLKYQMKGCETALSSWEVDLGEKWTPETIKIPS